MGKPQNPERMLYWEQYQFDRKKNDLRLETLTCAVRFGDWKAVQPKPNGPIELYNLKSDPMEAKDVASSNTAIVEKLTGMMKSAHEKPRTHSTGSFDFVE
jgi:hypothetical protein